MKTRHTSFGAAGFTEAGAEAGRTQPHREYGCNCAPAQKGNTLCLSPLGGPSRSTALNRRGLAAQTGTTHLIPPGAPTPDTIGSTGFRTGGATGQAAGNGSVKAGKTVKLSLRAVCLLSLPVMLSPSCSPRLVPVVSSRADTVRIVRQAEYREQLRDTTIYVEIPAESRESVRRDSSRLETSAAWSLARVDANGMLHHTLENKQVPLPARAQIRDTEIRLRNDTLSIRETIREVPVAMPLTRWQRFWIRAGQCGVAVLLIAAGIAVLKKRIF